MKKLERPKKQNRKGREVTRMNESIGKIIVYCQCCDAEWSTPELVFCPKCGKQSKTIIHKDQ
jgi:Zn finger protein HypA/HybF involved in hydrogenase expression